MSLETPTEKGLSKVITVDTRLLIARENNKFIALLTKKYIRYKRSYKLAKVLQNATYAAQGIVAASFVLILIPTVVLTPLSFMIVITLPTFALLLSPLHKFTRKDKFKYCMVFYEYLINEALQKNEINSDFLSFYDNSIRLFQNSPMFCEPFKIT